MATKVVGSFPAIAVTVLEADALVAGDNNIPHGLPFVPRVYSLVVTNASAITPPSVKGVDATNVVVNCATGNVPSKVTLVVGP